MELSDITTLLLNRIINSVGLGSDLSSVKAVSTVLNVGISTGDPNIIIASDICEALGITTRHNRATIQKILNKV